MHGFFNTFNHNITNNFCQKLRASFNTFTRGKHLWVNKEYWKYNAFYQSHLTSGTNSVVAKNIIQYNKNLFQNVPYIAHHAVKG